MSLVVNLPGYRDDPFLLETVPADTLIAGVAEDSGPVALTCACQGSCGAGLCAGCCNHNSVTCLER
ncbi:MAG: hypothetical protein J2P15_19745 [Micromonosporaceae bacterium]|nr:hypothetical protein [Micromonosporaceae bacterium]